MKKIKFLFMVAVALFLVSACEKQEIQYYSGGACVNFYRSALSYTFLGKSAAECPQDIIKCPLYIMGHLADYDRKVSVQVVVDQDGTAEEDRVTTATSDEYQIMDGIVPANSLEGTLNVIVKNNESRGNTTVKLRLTIVDNEDFKVGLRENAIIDLSWSRAIVPPSESTLTRFKTYCCDYYSTEMYKAWIAATGEQEFPYSSSLTFQNYQYGRLFGDYVRKYNAEHPDALLTHDDGVAAGQLIIPKY